MLNLSIGAVEVLVLSAKLSLSHDGEVCLVLLKVNFGILYTAAPDAKYPPFHQPARYLISLLKLFGAHASSLYETPWNSHLFWSWFETSLYELAHSTLAVIKKDKPPWLKTKPGLSAVN